VVTLSTLADAAVVDFYAKQGQKCCPSVSALTGKVQPHLRPELLSPCLSPLSLLNVYPPLQSPSSRAVYPPVRGVAKSQPRSALITP